MPRRNRSISRHRRTQRWRVVGAACAAALLISFAPISAAADQDDPRPIADVQVLSGRPDTITGGDALIRVAVRDEEDLHEIAVLAGGVDQTDALVVDEDAGALTGVVTGIPLGDSDIEVVLAEGDATAALRVTGYPQEGPVISGPHEDPFICETESAVQPVIGDSLGAPLDENCSLEDRVDYFYGLTGGGYAPWPEDASEYPDDLRHVTTRTGSRVPMIVRMETGTVNRAIFRTTILHDPLTDPEPSPTAHPAGWNGSAMFMFGGGCPGGWYRQGSTTGDVTAEYSLSQGYALMSSSLNVFGNNCNDLLAAESAMMVKEEFSERYGAPDHLIAWGSSGGSYQSLQIADNYPGILDGLIISDTFPDVGFATTNFITDAKLMRDYFEDTDTDWTDEQRLAVTGLNSWAIVTNVSGDARTNPRANCDRVPDELRYDPETNPAGARCDVFSHTKNAYGTDPDTGLPRRPMDNVGVQYGLAAVEDGTITVDQFLDLNDRIGGFDDDATIVQERTSGDIDAITAAYRTGRLLNGGGGLADIPIIDHRNYLDESAGGNIHIRYHSLSLRQRLIDANGTSANLVSLLRDSGQPQFSRQAIDGMGEWLTAIQNDDSDAAPIDKVIANRPATMQDGCYLGDGSGTFIAEPLDRDPESTCEQLYPSGSFPREVAGDTIAASVAKCRLAAPVRADYAQEFTEAQWARLSEIFPAGVCDYTIPGVAQQGLESTWLQFGSGRWTAMNAPTVTEPAR